MPSRTILLLTPATLLSGIVFLLPFAWLVATSFRAQETGSLLLKGGVTTANYVRLASDPFFVSVLARTFGYSVATTVLTLVIALPLARLIATGSGRLKGLLLALILVPLVSGALLPTLGMIHLLGPLGVLNGTLRALGLVSAPVRLLGTPAGVLVGLVQAFLPLMVLPLVNTLSRLPRDVEAAAASLGASPAWVWRRIVLPLSLPGIKAGALLVFCAAFTAFVTPQILGQGKVATFGTVTFQQASLVLDWPFASALAVATLGVLGLVALLSVGLTRLLSPGAGRARA